MKVEMVMPQMGESIAEGTILKWLKKEGDKINKDEIILEISTDKVDSEIPSPSSGILEKIIVKEGEKVPVKTVIAIINTESTVTQPSADVPHFGGSEPAKVVSTPSFQQPKTETALAFTKEAVTSIPARSDGKRFYSPLVRNIAQTEGITLHELDTVPGSGFNGRVTKRDILLYVEQRKTTPRITPVQAPSYIPPTPAPSSLPTYAMSDVEIIQMDNMRKSIAEHMVKSLHTSAHVFSVTEVDMNNIVNYREKIKDEFERKEGFKLTYTPFIVSACAKALKDFPWVNASVDGDKIVLKKKINIGVAVALESGLIVPVVKNADEKNLLGIARSVNELGLKARNKKLMPDDVHGGTFTVTNPGIFGNLFGLPIISQPQVAILGVGVIKKRVVVINDAIAIRPMMYISLSYDHRIIDGALGGQFLQRVVKYLENFEPTEI